jgi:hypothetical protein
MDALRSIEWTVARAGIGRSFLGKGFRPSSRAATARRSFRGERRPLSRVAGTAAMPVSGSWRELGLLIALG